MAREYQPRRFFRHAPNRLLQRYFAGRKVLAEVDFGAKKSEMTSLCVERVALKVEHVHRFTRRVKANEFD